MGLFGGIAKFMGGLNTPGADGLTTSDKLAYLASSFGDPEDFARGSALIGSKQSAYKKQAAQAAMEKQLGQLLGPQYQVGPDPVVTAPRVPGMDGQAAPATDPWRYQPPVRTSDGMTIDDPRLPALALQAQAAGVDLKDVLEVLKAHQPHVAIGPDGTPYNDKDPGALSRRFANRTNVNGNVVDLNNPANEGAYFGDAPVKGAMPLKDNTGRVVDWYLPGGAQGAIGAASAADQLGKTRGSVIDRPNGDGTTTPTLGADMFGAGGAGSGRTQSPAEAELARLRAQTQGTREAGQPKAFTGLQDQARTTDLVIDSIDRALSQIAPDTTGVGGLTRFVPGTRSRDLANTLDTIRANIGFDRLQEMRNNSPTGGALGSVSEQENKLLQSVAGSLDQGQSDAQLRANLAKVRQQLAQIRAQRQQLYDAQYSHPAAPDRAAIEAEMRRRGLLH